MLHGAEPGQPLKVAIGGPQGVGKSTLVSLVRSRQPDYLPFFVGEEFPPDFASRTHAERDLVRLEVGRRLETYMHANADRVLLVDLHYLDLRESDPRVQRPEILDLFDLHVLLTLTPELLAERRARDGTRMDRHRSLEAARRDVTAHLEYFHERKSGAAEWIVLDCAQEPGRLADELERNVDRRRMASSS